MPSTVFHSITPQQAKEKIDSGAPCLILDVREEEEYILEHIENAELLTLSQITPESAAAVIPAKDTPVLVYCRTGKRSFAACQLLARMGYTRLYDLGGLLSWPYELTWE